jgi:hypothetical protein
MVLDALITARFAVIEKAGYTGDGLPVLLLYRDSAGTSGLRPKWSAQEDPPSPHSEDN